MIIEGMLVNLLSVFDFLLSGSPLADISFDVSALEVFFDFISFISYLLPMRTVIDILSVIVGINLYKTLVATLKLLWSVLPFV